MMAADDRQNCHDEGGGWVGLAWQEKCAGQQNYAALGRQFGKDPETVKRNLKKYAAARAAERDDVDATAEYLDGLRHDLHEALEVYRSVGAANPNAQVGALKLAAQIRKDIAAACGVTTDRKTVGVGQADDLGPVKAMVLCALKDLDDADLPRFHASLATIFGEEGDDDGQ